MKWLVSAMVLFASSSGFAKGFERGMVKLGSGESLYVEHKHAKVGQPTLFLANGLTYSTTQWQALVTHLEEVLPDIGIVLFDMEGQGMTLLDRVPNVYGGAIPIFKQVQDLHDLRHRLSIDGPCVLGGLSYGGAITLLHAAHYPNDFIQYIAMAPFLERLEPQDRWIQRQIRYHRWIFPWDKQSDEELYLAYLEQLVRTTYPQAEPVILENMFKIEGVVRLVKGSKDFRAIELVPQLPTRKIHIIGGERDEHVKLNKLDEFVEALKPSALGSYIVLKWTRHKIPELAPRFTAAWIAELLRHPEIYSDGRSFLGDPLTGKLPTGDDSRQLTSKGSVCDGWLEKLFGNR